MERLVPDIDTIYLNVTVCGQTNESPCIKFQENCTLYAFLYLCPEFSFKRRNVNARTWPANLTYERDQRVLIFVPNSRSNAALKIG